MVTLLWMEDYFSPKKNLGGSFRRKRSVGRPWSRWEETVWKDAVFLLHIQNWKLVVQNRIRGRKLGWPWPERGPKCACLSIFSILLSFLPSLLLNDIKFYTAGKVLLHVRAKNYISSFSLSYSFFLSRFHHR